MFKNPEQNAGGFLLSSDFGRPNLRLGHIFGAPKFAVSPLEIPFLGPQNPKFFASLYDKPANVARKKVAMKAMELMLDRELLESELRQEMLLSVMLSGELNEKFRQVDRNLIVGK